MRQTSGIALDSSALRECYIYDSMPRKKSTRARRRPRLASEVAKNKRESGKPPVLNTARLLDLIRTHAGGSRTAFAALIKVQTSHVSKWADHGTAPGGRLLQKIAQVTGVSVDWLLNFEVPADRKGRAVVGDFARQLHRELWSAKPQFAHASLLGSPTDLIAVADWSESVVRNVVSDWWEHQRTSLSRRYSEALRKLAERLEADSTDVSDPRVATFMLQQARIQTGRSALLRADEGTWRDLVELSPGLLCSDIPGVSKVALQARDQSVIAYLQAPFLALGGQSGVGVAWRRDENNDEAWFIDAATMEAKREDRGLFLEELTIADRFGPLPRMPRKNHAHAKKRLVVTPGLPGDHAALSQIT